MQMYSIKEERQGLLIRPNGDIEPYAAKADHAFMSEDIIMDPIRLYNDTCQGFYQKPTQQVEHAAEQLAKQGYTVFQLPGKYSGITWGFAIILTENDTELD